ncbi:MAG: helix-turn-helix domain-containing protein [Theionarchaea archaeon]|nr:helix-turn-helix domain-containing protein [Theionarchaea archaeon]
MIAEIKEGFSERRVYVPRILGMDVLLALLEHGENLKVVILPPSIFVQTSQRVRAYLEKARVSLQKGDIPVGRPPRYTEQDIKEISRLLKEGTPITEISRRLRIPRRTIYYLLEKEDVLVTRKG